MNTDGQGLGKKELDEQELIVNQVVLTKSEPKKVATLITAHVTNDIYPHLYPGLLPIVLMPQLGFSIAAAGLISTVIALTTQLMQPVLGLWADKLGGRGFVVGGLLVGSIIVPLTLGWAPTYPLLLLGLLLGGLGNAAFHPHASALMSEMTGKFKGSGMSLFMVGGNFGRLLAPILASLALYLGGRQGLWILAIPGLVMAVVMFFSMNPPPVPKYRKGKIFTLEFFQSVRQRGGLLLLSIVGLRFMTVMSVVTLVPIMWARAGIEYGVYNLLLTVIFAAGMIGNIIGGTLSDFIGRKPIIIVSAICSALALALFVKINTIIGGFILIAILGAFLYSADPVVMVFSHQIFPENKGMASGIIGLGGMLGSLGVTLTGFISDIYSPQIGLYVAAAAMMMSIPFMYKLKEQTKQL